MTIRYADLAEVIEWRRNAGPGDWISFASGEELDRSRPVVALVRGWERHGLVEVVSDSDLGFLRHRFKRTRADFPAGWFDPIPMLPERPPAIRDPAAVGLGAMARFAIEGEEDASWLRHAALEVADRLARHSVALVWHARHPDRENILATLEPLTVEAEEILRAAAELLDSDGISARSAKIKWRRSGGGQRTGGRIERVKKEYAAAMAAEAAKADEKRELALLAVRKSTGISEGRINARLAQTQRIRNWQSNKELAEAIHLVQAMTAGGSTQENAFRDVATATGLELAAIRKALRKKRKSE